MLNENQCVVHRVSWYCVRVFRGVGCVSSIGARCIVGEIKNNPSTHERYIVYEPNAWELTKQTCVSTVDGCAIDTQNLRGCIFHLKLVAR